MTNDATALGHPYEIESVEKADAPSGAEGSDWYCYVITQGSNTIQGCRQGNRKAVTCAVEEIVIQLNERRLGKRGRVHLVMKSKGKKES